MISRAEAVAPPARLTAVMAKAQRSLQLSYRLPQDGLEFGRRCLSWIAEIDLVVKAVECQLMLRHEFGVKVFEFWRLIIVRTHMEQL